MKSRRPLSDAAPLHITHVLGARRFDEFGRPLGAVLDRDRRLAALFGGFDLLYWPARATYRGHRLRHRLSLYDLTFRERYGIFDGARFPINDAALHPSEPLVAIATGSYDGGYFFEGDLLLWNWRTNETTSVLRENREVVRCRFDSNGHLFVLLAPRDEEEFGDMGDDRALTTYVGCDLGEVYPDQESRLDEEGRDLRLARLTPIEPSALGFGKIDRRWESRRERFFAVLGPVADTFEERNRVWDVAWLDDDRIALVHDNALLEIWTKSGGSVMRENGLGHGVQILCAQGRRFVHVIERPKDDAVITGTSTLYTLEGDSLREVRRFDRVYGFSIDGTGSLLARDAGDPSRKRSRRDLVLGPDGRTSFETDLGHYDCFNHYLRLDGGPEHYYLRGTPASSHEHKKLCGNGDRLDAVSG